MKPSGWLFLATACLAVLGLLVFWPALIVAAATLFGAIKQRETEKKAATRARYAHQAKR